MTVADAVELKPFVSWCVFVVVEREVASEGELKKEDGEEDKGSWEENEGMMRERLVWYGRQEPWGWGRNVWRGNLNVRH